MKKYIIKRILISIPLIIGITFITFCLINLIPSDPAEVALRVNDITPTEADIHKMRELLGLNRPFFLRYFDWLWKSLHFDFGISYVNTNSNVKIGGSFACYDIWDEYSDWNILCY